MKKGNGKKYLTLVSSDDNKSKLKKYDPGKYDKNNLKINFNSDENFYKS